MHTCYRPADIYMDSLPADSFCHAGWCCGISVFHRHWQSGIDRSTIMITGICQCRCVFFITALHAMQTRSSDENSVRPSVCLSVRLSVRHTRDPWQNGRKIGPDFYTIWKNIYPSFLRRRMVGGGRPLLREIWGQPTPVGAKLPIFNQ